MPLRPGVVSAWAGLGTTGLLLAQDDRLAAYTVPGLDERGQLQLEDNVFRIAVHPSGTWAALATGAQGNFETHGNLLRLELDTWCTRPLLTIDREVVDCEFLSDGRLRFVLGWTDEADQEHHECCIVPGDAPVVPGALRPLTAAERSALERRGEPA